MNNIFIDIFIIKFPDSYWDVAHLNTPIRTPNFFKSVIREADHPSPK